MKNPNAEAKTFAERKLLDRVPPEARLPQPVRQDDRIVQQRRMFGTRGDEAGIEHPRLLGIEDIASETGEIGFERTEIGIGVGVLEQVHARSRLERRAHGRIEPRANEAVGVQQHTGAPVESQRAREDERLGAEVAPVAAAPDGENINVGCGATDLSLLQSIVVDGRYDLGIAFDGDGDRMLAVDGEGDPVDGDQIVAILALDLKVDLVAVTVMTNLGFHRLMGERGVRVITTDVGDRYVLEALRKHKGVLGGEQSGHIIYLRDHVTGDGLAAALLLCGGLKGRTLREAAAVLPRYPQAQQNVPVGNRALPPSLLAEVERINSELGERGRVLVRASGTEPVIRVLAEAQDYAEAQDLCGRICALVERELG